MTAKNIARKVVLEPEQHVQLESLAASRSLRHALVMRAQIVPMAAEGTQSIDIATKVRMTRESVGKWCKRFLEYGLQGLHDELRPGRPRTVSDERVAELLKKTLETKPKNGTHWSCRALAEETNISKATVQHLIDSSVPDELNVHLVVDNYTTHKHAKVKAWLAQRPRFQVHFTPNYCSWINQIERWFGIITQLAIRRGSFRSVKELVSRIEIFVDNYNQNSRSFMWTATADSIFAKLRRLCEAISEPAH